MGKGTTTTQAGSGVQERQPTAEETQMNKYDLALREATQSGMIGMNQAALGLGEQLLKGGELPGWMSGITGGINDAVVNSMIGQQGRDIQAGMASNNMLDSGTNAALSARGGRETRTGVAQWNLQNNLNALSLALTGNVQLQEPIMSNSSAYGSRLTTLGQTTKSYTGTSRTEKDKQGGFWGSASLGLF